MDLASVKNDDEHVPAIVKFKANQDILDRSGLSADTLFGKGSQGSDENTLRVVVSTSSENETKVRVDFKRGG